MVKNGNFTLLLRSSGQEWQLYIATEICSQEWQFHRDLVVKNGNFTLLLRSSGQEWQFHIATEI